MVKLVRGFFGVTKHMLRNSRSVSSEDLEYSQQALGKGVKATKESRPDAVGIILLSLTMARTRTDPASLRNKAQYSCH